MCVQFIIFMTGKKLFGILVGTIFRDYFLV